MVPETNKVALFTHSSKSNNQTENWCRKIHNVHSTHTPHANIYTLTQMNCICLCYIVLLIKCICAFVRFVAVVVVDVFSVAAALMFNSRYKLCDARVHFISAICTKRMGKSAKGNFYCMHYIVCVHFFGWCCCCHALMKLLSFCLATHINSMFYSIFDHHNFFSSNRCDVYTHTYTAEPP